jgi:hypothetical protein
MNLGVVIAVLSAMLCLSAPAQSQVVVSDSAMTLAQTAAGSAKVSRPRVDGDTLYIAVQDAGLTGAALAGGPWRLGGQRGTPKAVGLRVAQAVVGGLRTSLPVRMVVVEVDGASGDSIQVRLFYYPAEFGSGR